MYLSLVSFVLLAGIALASPLPDGLSLEPGDTAEGPVLKAGALADGPYSTSGRWIVDKTGARQKLRCVNWAGHGEVNIPEGLQHQPIDNITTFIATNNFNCVRLTYSTDFALNPDVKVKDSFDQAAKDGNLPLAEMQALYASALKHNPFLDAASRVSTFDKVIASLADKGVKVVLDNHVSKAKWCCSQNDGNGWFKGADREENSQHFDVADWLKGLTAVATFAGGRGNVIGMSLRNELRPTNAGRARNDWYEYVGQGAAAVAAANKDLLIVIGGMNFALDIGFLYDRPLDTSKLGAKVVWEFHWYDFSNGEKNCGRLKKQLGHRAGFLLKEGQPYTGPLWLSEFGTDISKPNEGYVSCVVEYMTSNDADWAIWALQGDYYTREGKVSNEESWGLMKADWSGWRNDKFPATLGKMWDQTQGPTGKA
ncbi:MAG: hypothetical protein M1832_000738 [Thelocarpon impressellum]|nr:MAG: hypothetical protein M1832_000738 [Thelocarpon impressellum]